MSDKDISGTYKISIKCINCGWGGGFRHLEYTDIPKGKLSDEYLDEIKNGEEEIS